MSAAVGRVCAVVVTYNRRALLEECLTALGAQTRPVDHILVVDNASGDGTPDFVRERFPDAELLALERNVGGAGGFRAGIERAHAAGCDWLWLMDDDTIPTAEALEELVAAPARLDGVTPTVLASKVLNESGELHVFNRPWPRVSDFPGIVDGVEHGLLEIRYASFVSILVRADAVDRHGLPLADYFIWSDDLEFTARILRHERGYLVPSSVVIHKNRSVGAAAAPPERYYLAVRNTLWLLRSGSLESEDRLVKGRFALQLARGMVMHVRLAKDRRKALAAIARGLRDGAGRLPA